MLCCTPHVPIDLLPRVDLDFDNQRLGWRCVETRHPDELDGRFLYMTTLADERPSGSLPDAAEQNLDVMARFYEREEAEVSGARRAIELVSNVIGSPAYFGGALVFICGWVLVNFLAARIGWRHVDEPPFFWLQGIVSANALLVTVAVLIRQKRTEQLAEHRAHLDLQINLMTEQKVAKVLQIVDELRSHLTGTHEPPDATLSEMGQPTDPQALLHAIKRNDVSR